MRNIGIAGLSTRAILCANQHFTTFMILLYDRHFACSLHLPFYLKIFIIVWKNIGKSVFVAVQDSCTYAGTKLCLNDHYLCETFSLGWTGHHCNTTPMWELISLQVLIEHLPQLAWMPTYGIATRDFRHQRAVYLESLSHEFNSNCSLPCQCHLRDKVWTPNPGHLANAHLANGHLANGHLANGHLANKCMGGHSANRQF